MISSLFNFLSFWWTFFHLLFYLEILLVKSLVFFWAFSLFIFLLLLLIFKLIKWQNKSIQFEFSFFRSISFSFSFSFSIDFWEWNSTKNLFLINSFLSTFKQIDIQDTYFREVEDKIYTHDISLPMWVRGKTHQGHLY